MSNRKSRKTRQQTKAPSPVQAESVSNSNESAPDSIQNSPAPVTEKKTNEWKVVKHEGTANVWTATKGDVELEVLGVSAQDAARQAEAGKVSWRTR